MDQVFQIVVYFHGPEPRPDVVRTCIAETLNGCNPMRDHTSDDYEFDGTPCEVSHRVTGRANHAAITVQVIPND